MKLAILFGAASYEHEISIVSAITVSKKLKQFDLTYIFCDTDHQFYLIDSSALKANYFSSKGYSSAPKLQLSMGAFVQKRRFSTIEHTMPVLNLIHGGDGEDGTISSLLEFYKIDYIGPRIDASVLSYDKRLTKMYAKSCGVKVLEHEEVSVMSSFEIKTQMPFIIKPSRLGSSIGVSVVREERELYYHLDVALEFDQSVIVEPFIENVKEYNLAGYRSKRGIVYSIVEEPQKGEILDFDKKYLDFSRESEVQSAPIHKTLKRNLEEAFERIYNTMFDGALIRCDFFVIDDEIYLNEINSVPGSMSSYLFEDFGLCVQELLVALPKKKEIKIEYQYINSINSAKGK